jgi:hypothetical protein
VEFYISSAPTAPAPDFTNAVPVLWTLVTNATFAKAPGVDTYTGEPDVSLHGCQGRWLAMRMLSSQSDPAYIGISELQVFAQVTEMPDWNFHMDVTLAGYSGTTTLTDFPCALRLSEDLPGFRYSTFSSPGDGGDLRVTDVYGRPLLHEIEKWDPSGTSIVWVAVANLIDETSTVKLHWNNTAATTPAYATNGTFWSSSYGGVWHLDQSAGVDSTTNRNDGTANGNMTVSGILDAGQYFDGNDYIEVPDDDSIGSCVTQALTVSTWLKSDVTLERTNATYRLLEKGDCYFILQGINSAGGLAFLVKTNNTSAFVGNGADVSSNKWHHVGCTYDGLVMRLYLDGVQKGSRAQTGPIDDDKKALRIGSDDERSYFKGILDETRIESVARSADWIKACFDNQREQAEVYPAPPSGTIILIL